MGSTDRLQAGGFPERGARGPDVLLVEDNVVNQKVAGKLLERMGCSVVIANNGEQAVAACRDRQFGLVIMDMQMPIMDGLQATRAIRTMEGSTRHTPIVALSANAMPDQVAQCLEAGMDDFLAKPVNVTLLREVVEAHGAVPTASAAPASTTAAPIDLDHLRRLSDDDQEFTAELVALFMESSVSAIGEIRDAQAHADRSAIARAAHKLKGASANVCAHPMLELAARLETDSASMSSQQIEDSICALASETQRLQNFLRETHILAA